MIQYFIRTLLVPFLIFFCLSAAAHQHSHSHSHSHSAGGGGLSHIKEVYEMAAALSPEVLKAGEESIVQPYLKIGKESIPLNSGFWQLVKGWIRLYRSEIQEHCTCDIDENKLVQEAKNHVAKGFVYSKLGRPVAHWSEYVVVGAYGLSAKYGKAALILKASAEVAETILSVFVGGKGVHIICNIIDAMIIFLFRKSQIYMRVFSNSKTVNKNRMLMMFRLAYINRLMKKARRKVFFYLESANVNQKALALVDAEGIKRNRRANWVRTLSDRATPVLNRIRKIDKELEDETLSKRQREKLSKERKKLSRTMEDFTEISTKHFFGKRYKRFLFLLSRKGNKNYLKGTDFSDRLVATDWLWPLAIQENILERVLVSEAESGHLHQNYRTTALKTDEIRKGLAEEFVGKMQKNTHHTEYVQAVEQVLADIEKVFDPSLTVTKRYLLVSVMETVLVGFFEHYVRLTYNELSQSTSDLNIWGRARLRWRLDRFVYHIFMYSDFLRTVALVKDKTKITSYKYESMESFLLFFDYLKKLSRLSHSRNTKENLLAQLDQNIQNIRSFHVHLEKRTAFSWIPFSNPIPYCRTLGRVSK